MRAVVQRVSKAQVSVDEEIVGSIGTGLVVLLAVGSRDGSEDLGFMVRKLVNLRVFNDAGGKVAPQSFSNQRDILVEELFL